MRLLAELRALMLSDDPQHAPLLRRLFPPAYHLSDDAEAEAEYQRFMRDDLVASRLESIDHGRDRAGRAAADRRRGHAGLHAVAERRAAGAGHAARRERGARPVDACATTTRWSASTTSTRSSAGCSSAPCRRSARQGTSTQLTRAGARCSGAHRSGRCGSARRRPPTRRPRPRRLERVGQRRAGAASLCPTATRSRWPRRDRTRRHGVDGLDGRVEPPTCSALALADTRPGRTRRRARRIGPQRTAVVAERGRGSFGDRGRLVERAAARRRPRPAAHAAQPTPKPALPVSTTRTGMGVACAARRAAFRAPATDAATCTDRISVQPRAMRSS